MTRPIPRYRATAVIKARKIADYEVVVLADSERQALLGLNSRVHEEIRLGIEVVEISIKVGEIE